MSMIPDASKASSLRRTQFLVGLAMAAMLVAPSAHAQTCYIQPLPNVSTPWGFYPSGAPHRGCDYVAAAGTPIPAIADATVWDIVYGHPCMGNIVVLAHPDGLYSSYSHLSTAEVSVGQRLARGQRFATVGNTGSCTTGPHVHVVLSNRPRAYWDAPLPTLDPYAYIEAHPCCRAGQVRACGSDIGACVSGAESCSGGSWGGCVGGVSPVAEDCNGIDDDCNGVVDDGWRACGTDVGECVAGVQTCAGATWTLCEGEVAPTAEVCDTLDNDCDGQPDEEFICEIEELTLQGQTGGRVNSDVDGDGDADVCACGANALECHLASGHGFERQVLGPSLPTTGFEDASRYSSLRMGDIDGDGQADACLRDETGVRCWISEGDGFGFEVEGPALSDAEGFDQPAQYTTLRMADVNGDGMDDLCARWPDGLRCYMANGHGFDESLWLAELSDEAGFGAVERYGTLRMDDIDGDGRADVCARSAEGMVCWHAGEGGFTDSVLGPAWGDAQGFSDVVYWSTIRLADVDGDGRADLCARTPTGFACHPATATGFGDPYLGPEFRSDDGWDGRSRFSTLRMGDVSGDGRADLCARHSSGVLCWVFTGRGFDRLIEGPPLSDAVGWGEPAAYRTIRLADVNRDGFVDVCGRDASGLRCWLSAGRDFLIEVPGPAWAEGWDAPRRFATIRLGSVPSAGGATPPTEGDAGGCACTATGAPATHGTWLLLLLAPLLRRRGRKRFFQDPGL